MNLCFICQEPNQPGVEYCAHCGVQLSTPAAVSAEHLARGVLLAKRYQIERVLGSGGFAHAYRALDTRLKRACVVKEMLQPADASEEEIAELKRNFEREVDALVALNHPGHPNIPEIYDYFSSRSGHYLVMKYIEGQDLEQMLAGKGRLAWQKAVDIGIAVCDALVYMHSRQPPVLHRDIKPANILIESSGRIWLVDFGLSKAQPTIRGGQASGTTAFGTAGYTALEQWMEKAVPASDIYALAATLHHLLTGHDPRLVFDGQPDLSQVREEHGHFPPIRQFNEMAPQRLERLLSRAVAAQPSQRPTAQELHAALSALRVPAITPFNFRNGQAATSLIELAALSQENREEAREHLYNGPFETWLEEVGQYDEVRELKKLTQQFDNRDIGLDKFIRVLNPNLPAPRVKVEANREDFGDYTNNFNIPVKIEITNDGPGWFYGRCQLEQKWLVVSHPHFALAPKNSFHLTVSVPFYDLDYNQSYTNKLMIKSDDNNSFAILQLATFNFSLHTATRSQRLRLKFQNILKDDTIIILLLLIDLYLIYILFIY